MIFYAHTSSPRLHTKLTKPDSIHIFTSPEPLFLLVFSGKGWFPPKKSPNQEVCRKTMGGVSEVSVDFGLSCGRMFDGGRVGNSISMGSLVALVAWEKGGVSNLVMFFSNFQSTQKKRAREREREREKKSCCDEI